MANAPAARVVVSVSAADAALGIVGGDLATLRQELLHGDGYAILRGVASTVACDALREASLERASHQPFDAWPGVHSKRLKDPLEWGGDAAAAVVNAITSNVRPLIDDILGPGAWITSLQSLALYPTTPEEMSAAFEDQLVTDALHSDYPYGEFKEGMDRAVAASATGVGQSSGDWQFPQDYPQPRTLQLIIVLDQFTRERGATRMVPGSSRLGVSGKPLPGDDKTQISGIGVRIPSSCLKSDRVRFLREAIVVEAGIGDCIVYIGHTWHTIAVNRGQTPRVGFLVQVSPFYFAPLEAAAWTTPLHAQRRLTRGSCELLGLPGSTIEGVGAEGGGDDARVPHRDEPRPLLSCAMFAIDTARRARIGSLYRATGATSAAAAVVAVVGALAMRRDSIGVRCFGQFVSVSAAIGFGYILGATATLRRFDF